jgi:hypothetical protein
VTEEKREGELEGKCATCCSAKTLTLTDAEGPLNLLRCGDPRSRYNGLPVLKSMSCNHHGHNGTGDKVYTYEID